MTLIPNKGPWRDVAFSRLHLIDEEAGDDDANSSSSSNNNNNTDGDRRLSSSSTGSAGGGGGGGGIGVGSSGLTRRVSSSSAPGGPVAATADNLFPGTKVSMQRNEQKIRCVVVSVNAEAQSAHVEVDPDQYAPVAQTCTFTLKVPKYSSVDVAAKQLRRAIVEEGMHLD